MRLQFTGIGTALVTPFTKNGALDETAVRRLAARQIAAGIHFLVPCGTTGETPTLTSEEKIRVVEIVAEEAEGRAMVLAGAGGYDTREIIQSIPDLERAGAHGILSVTPYYSKPTQEGLFQHYRAIAESTTLPIVLYNVPGRTGCNLEPPTVARLSAIPNIVGVKEASPNMAQTVEILRLVPSEFLVLSGDDELTLPRMAIGARGAIAVTSNQVPAEMVQMVEAAERGDFASARRWHEKLIGLVLSNFVEANPIPVKFAMAQMGLCEGAYRLPLVTPSQSAQQKIIQALRDFGLPVVAETHA